LISVESQEKILNESLFPKKYKVILLNDDYTTMDFVIFVLMNVFYKNYNESYDIMMQIHKQNSGICGEYTLDVAITKTNEVKDLAKENEYPLKAIYEEI
jgi:ATP-dependent Clp protease adaptor protein ClpS